MCDGADSGVVSQPAFDFGDEPLDDPGNPTYTVGELADAINMSGPELQRVIKTATRSGELHRLNDHRYALPQQLLHFSRRLVEADQEDEALTVVNLKTRFESGRNLTIELLEYFDSIHFTRRDGDKRIVVNPAAAQERFRS